jgi:hypothetical protein
MLNISFGADFSARLAPVNLIRHPALGTHDDAPSSPRLMGEVLVDALLRAGPEREPALGLGCLPARRSSTLLLSPAALSAQRRGFSFARNRVFLLTPLPDSVRRLPAGRRLADDFLDVLRDQPRVREDHGQPILIELHLVSEFIDAHGVFAIGPHRREVRPQGIADD